MPVWERVRGEEEEIEGDNVMRMVEIAEKNWIIVLETCSLRFLKFGVDGRHMRLVETLYESKGKFGSERVRFGRLFNLIPFIHSFVRFHSISVQTRSHRIAMTNPNP